MRWVMGKAGVGVLTYPSRMKILDKYVVYQGNEPALFPGLTRAANGDILVSFCTRFDCLPGGEAFLIRSVDEGRTWTQPKRIYRSNKPDGCINLSVGLMTLHKGTVLYPCSDTRITRKWDQHDADLVVLRSDDHGHTWSGPTPYTVGVKEPFAYGRIVELPNGELLCPIWGKRVPNEPWRSGLVRSRDGGQTWGEHVTIAYDPKAVGSTRSVPPPEVLKEENGAPSDGISSGHGVEGNGYEPIHCAGYNETTLLDLSGGHLLAIVRQQGIAGRKRDLFRSVSNDEGRHWSEPECLPLWGTSPSLHLASRNLILLGYRNHLGNPQGLTLPGIGLSISHDGGKSFHAHGLLEDPRGYQYNHEFDAGYPAFLNLDDNRLLVLFYSYDPSLPSERYLAANVLSLEMP